VTSTHYGSKLLQPHLHLVNARPQEGKRMIGLGAAALWELWQRISELERAAQQQRTLLQDVSDSRGWA
jgi:hypothetical protein